MLSKEQRHHTLCCWVQQNQNATFISYSYLWFSVQQGRAWLLAGLKKKSVGLHKKSCNKGSLFCFIAIFSKGNDLIFGSVLVRNCVPTFVVHTALVISNISRNGCNAAITFGNHCSSLLFADIIVHVWY